MILFKIASVRLNRKATPRYRIQKFLSHSNYLIHGKRRRNDYLHLHHIEVALLKMTYSRKQIPRPKSKCKVIRSYICRFCELQPKAGCNNIPYPAFEMEHVPVPSLDFDPASRYKSLSSPTSRHILNLIPHFAKPVLCSTLTFSIIVPEKIAGLASRNIALKLIFSPRLVPSKNDSLCSWNKP